MLDHGHVIVSIHAEIETSEPVDQRRNTTGETPKLRSAVRASFFAVMRQSQ